MSGYDVMDALDHMDPADPRMTYEMWLEVGMALHEDGYPLSTWDDWSRRDFKRYKDGECKRKWEGFGQTLDRKVTVGTIVDMARNMGWSPKYDLGYALSWDMSSAMTEHDPSWIEPIEVDEPKDGEWHGYKELIDYLKVLFEPGETVGYVTNAYWNGEKWVPKDKGTYTRTAGELIESLLKYQDDVPASMGKPHEQGGAWIRFNPLDGNGVKNINVSEFRYALVESDDMEIDKQRGLIEEMRLPVATLVHSGGKSLHAVVHVDAKDYNEYRQRVDYLYRTCKKYGMTIDEQNKNPSRLSRMPGIMRGEKKQYLIATNIGCANWNEWKDWIEDVNDDLPEPDNLGSVWDNIPPLAEPIIEGVLRKGHKMLIAGPSKAGKSYALIEMCIAIAEGSDWMGFKCAQGGVLYVNLEVDRSSCLNRFKDVYAALGLEPDNISKIDIWNLRGKSKPMDALAPSLIRRAMRTRPAAVVIDPIYKVITGDENSADQMARFCNQFDMVANELGCAVIYCHHHSKGAQGGKRAMDRASGSGVFTRDPDAIIDMIELEVEDEDEERTALRIEGTLREFASFKPVDVWFDHPIHVVDTEGVLKDCRADDGSWSNGADRRNTTPEERADARRVKLETAFDTLAIDGTTTIKELSEYLGVTEKTVKNHLKEHGGFWREEGEVGRKQ